jgi:hypothetical protein
MTGKYLFWQRLVTAARLAVIIVCPQRKENQANARSITLTNKKRSLHVEAPFFIRKILRSVIETLRE